MPPYLGLCTAFRIRYIFSPKKHNLTLSSWGGIGKSKNMRNFQGTPKRSCAAPSEREFAFIFP